MVQYRVDENSAEVAVLMAEYDHLVKEKHLNMGHELTIVNLSITVSGALITLALSQHIPSILLLCPLTSSLFGMLAVQKSRGIVVIGQHIGAKIIPRIQSKENSSILMWDSGTTSRRKVFKKAFLVYHLPNMGIFMIPVIASLLIFITSYEQVWRASIISLFSIDLALVTLYILCYFYQLYWKFK